MIFTFTDFGPAGPYLGQMRAAILRLAPSAVVIDLMADAPVHNPRASSYLLAAYSESCPPDSTLLCVVDPGVGTDTRAPIVVRAGGRWYVGPDNGLFDIVAGIHDDSVAWKISWAPPTMSSTFHGRDLFAPVAAWLDSGASIHDKLELLPAFPFRGWPTDSAEIVYVDHFGNAVTGIRASTVFHGDILEAGGRRINGAATFGEVAVGEAFWFSNSSGLVEISINQGSAAERLGLAIGSHVAVVGAGNRFADVRRLD